MSIEKVKNLCCGCSACVNICPFNALETKRSSDGFLYPAVSRKNCSNCGLCESVCPVLNEGKKPYPIEAYYGRAKDSTIVKKSSSGGIFSVIAEKVIKNGGVVFGAAFDKKSKEVVIESTENVSLEALRRSKYVESNPKDSFKRVKKLLDSGIYVFFMGLPCEVSGLKMYLKREYDNLLTADFLCGGAASSKYFREHLNYLEKKYKSTVESVNFRPKLYGWKEHSFKVDFESGAEYKSYAYLDTYFRGFVFEKALIRDCCYNCMFSGGHDSDIILADFWGYKQLENQQQIDDKGTSLIMANTQKGIDFVKMSEDELICTQLPLEYISYAFKSGNDLIGKKQKFLSLYERYGFEKAAKKAYMSGCLKFRVKKFIKRVIGK